MYKTEISTDDKKFMKNESLHLDTLKLPTRLPDQQLVKPIRKIAVNTNCYNIKFKKPIVIQHYEFRFIIENRYGKKDLSFEVPKTDIGQERRRSVLWKLFCQLVQQNKTRFADPLKYVFDCMSMVITTETLPLENGLERIALDANLLDEEHRSYLPKSIDQLYVEIKYVREVKIDSTHLLEDTLENPDRSSLQILDLIFNQKIVSSNSFHVYPQKSYLKKAVNGADRSQEIQGRIMKDGLAKSVRICSADNPDRVGLMLLAEVGKSVFFPDKSLLDYLLNHFNCRDSRDLERFSSKLHSELKRLTLITTHMKKNRIFVCDGVDKRSPREITFTIETYDSDGNVLKKRLSNVMDYMEQKYKIRINGYLPTVFQNVKDRNGQKNTLYYPIEVLKIVAGQRVPLTKMEPRFQDNMIKQARMDPQQLCESTNNVLRAGFLTASNPFARNFNVPMESKFIVVNDAICLPPPTIKAGKGVIDPDNNGNLNWRAPMGFKYLIGGKARKWMVVNYNGTDSSVIKDFLRKFVDELKKRGTSLDENYKLINENRFHNIRKTALEMRPDYLLVITKDKMDPVHNDLKHFEIESKIVTQNLWHQTVFNVARKNQNQTLENILLKTNEKLGGVNFTVTTSNAFNYANPSMKNAIDNWMGPNSGRMFIGLSLNHSGAVSHDSTASAVGLAYTCDEFVKGFYFFNKSKQTIIEGLENELQKPILDYKKYSVTKQWPKHIFIYRSGVSEGEYLYVTGCEKRAIKECFEKLRQMHRDFVEPGFTLIVAQRNSGLRLTPNDLLQSRGNGLPLKDWEKNLKPGTLISKGITNPMLEEFVLTAHKTLQGTGRPIKYTVLADERIDKKRTPSDELKMITYCLCHLHNSVFGTVHVPNVLYHAGSLAKRASNNLKVQLNISSNSTMDSSDYIESLNKQLRTSLNTKFWA